MWLLYLFLDVIFFMAYWQQSLTTSARTVRKLLSSVSRNPRVSRNPIQTVQSQNVPFYRKQIVPFTDASCCETDVSCEAKHIWRYHSDMLDYNALISAPSDWSTTTVFTSLHGFISHKTWFFNSAFVYKSAFQNFKSSIKNLIQRTEQIGVDVVLPGTWLIAGLSCE